MGKRLMQSYLVIPGYEAISSHVGDELLQDCFVPRNDKFYIVYFALGFFFLSSNISTIFSNLASFVFSCLASNIQTTYSFLCE